MTVSKTTDANRTHGTIVLRGGRLTKWKGKAASLSPSLGQLIASVSPVALGRALMVGASRTATAAVLGGAGLIVTTSGASAACTAIVGQDGVYTCSGEIDKTNGGLEKNPLTPYPQPSPLSVTISEGTTVNVTSGDAFNLENYSQISRRAGITFEDETAGARITGGRHGIHAENKGTGALSITTTGTTRGKGTVGIIAINDGTDLTINAATTMGVRHGIQAENKGTGALSITTTGTTRGTNISGIYAYNSAASTGDLTINVTELGAVTGGNYGIKARNLGTGALSITTSGKTTGKGSNAEALLSGINAINRSGTSLTINAAETEGRKYGIYAKNEGKGALSITTTGNTTGTTYFGIKASIDNADSPGDLTIVTGEFDAEGNLIEAVDTKGGRNGIFAQNNGTGALSITTTGTTTGKTKDGIFARNGGFFNRDSTSLTINAATTTGGRYGIYATNYGTDLTINAATTTGGRHGIYAINYGTGALSITTTGTTTGKWRNGIYARNEGTSLTIKAADTYGRAYGINAKNEGTGALSITTTGKTTGGTGHGIYAYNAGSGGTSITVASTGSIETSADKGFGIYNKSSGTAAKLNEITVAGSITTAGEGAHGIYNLGDFNKTILAAGGSILTTKSNTAGIFQAGDNNTAYISGEVNSGLHLRNSVSGSSALYNKSGKNNTFVLEESGVIIGAISAGNAASNNTLKLNDDADFELIIGGAPDEGEPGRGTGAGQWSFQLVDEQGLPSNKGQNVDFVEVDASNCATGSTICVKAIYEEPSVEDQFEEITNIDNDALVDSLELGGSDKSGSSSTTAAQAHHNTVWANVYGIKTTGDETDSRDEMKSRTAGFTIGVPIRTNSDLNWDLVFNMSDSKNKLGSTGDQELNVQSYNLGAVFYNIAPSSGWDVDAFGFIGYNDYDQERDVRDNTEADGIDTRKFSYSGNEILLGFDAEYYKPFNETLDLKFGVNGFLSHQKIASYSSGEYYKWDTRNMTQGSIGVSTGVEHRKGALMAYADIGVDYVTLLSGKTADYSFNGQSRSFTASDTDDVYGKVNVGFEYNQSENVIIDGKLSGFSSTGGISGYAATLGIEVNF